LDLVIAAVEHAGLRRRLEFWRGRPAGFDFTPAAHIAANTGYPIRLAPDHLLSPPAVAATIDLTADIELPLQVSASLSAARNGVLDGIGGWFVAHLSPTVTMTNSPLSPDRIYRRPIFFPIEHGVRVQPGTPIDVRMRILPSETMYAWDVRVEEARFHHTTLRGMLLAREDLIRTNPGYVPKLTRAGEARMTVLQFADGQRTLAEIERCVYERHKDFFASPAHAALFVAEVVTRYG
jgi:hypothetical protein